MKDIFFGSVFPIGIIGIGFIEIYVPPINLAFTIIGYALIIMGAFALGMFFARALLERRWKI
jgi:hypothetical protein